MLEPLRHYLRLVVGVFYRQVLKRLLFLVSPETIHQRMIKFGQLGNRWGLNSFWRQVFVYHNVALVQTLHGVVFPNPVGLAGGFDKNAELPQVLPDIGFGLVEVGSITAEPCAGNAKPRLWRLPEHKSIIVNYGLANDGVETVAAKLKRVEAKVPLGTNIAYTNTAEIDTPGKAIADYVISFIKLKDLGDYFVINISCPNVVHLNLFWHPDNLDRLLAALDQIKTDKLIFLKIGADMPLKNLDQIVEVARRHRVHGFVCTNLTKQRFLLGQANLMTLPQGGLSGKPVLDLSDQMIKYLYSRCGQEFIIIGCGGIFSAEDAYRKIRLGASLVQLVTGMIYEGPQLIGEINWGLTRLLGRDGFTSLAQAVGRGV